MDFISLNIKYKSIKVKKKKQTECFQVLRLIKELRVDTKSTIKRKKSDKLDFMKIKDFYSAKDPVKWWKEKLHSGRKYLEPTCIKGLISRNYKEHSNFNSKKPNHLIKKWAQYMKRHFIEEEVQMTN